MNTAATVRPSWWYGLIGLAFILFGAGVFAYLLISGILHVTDSLIQVVVPGQAELPLMHPGTYTVFYESQSVVNNRIYSTPESISGLECSVHAKGSTSAIPLFRPRMSTTYNVGGRSGKSALEFTVAQPGRYHFSCDYPEQSKGPEVVLAVGSGVGPRIVKTVLGSLFALFGGGVAGGLIILVVYLLREREKKRMALTSGPQAQSS